MMRVRHSREAVQRFEDAGALFNAAGTRFNIALTLARAGRREDALEYAEAALRGFESYGATESIEETRGLIAEIHGA
jgi:tetratricopeptide (TPR) repeat protein